jgi:ankyrin repeat protein
MASSFLDHALEITSQASCSTCASVPLSIKGDVVPMSAETLRQVFVRAPAGSCSEAVLDTLIGLAYDTDFEAKRALARIMARELDLDDDSPGFVRARSMSELVAANDVPALLRLYLLALTPRDLFANVEVATLLAATVPFEPGMEAFQRLVVREAPVQHEVLKAYVVAAFAHYLQSISAIVNVSQGGLLRTLDTILGDCRVVPGDNATSDFEFGKDLLVRLTGPGLFGIIFHELGHHAFKTIGGGQATSAAEVPVDKLVGEVVDALPTLLETAARLRGTPIARGDRRAFRASSGLTFLCSNDVATLGSFVHLSIMQDGGPVELERASQLAYAVLDVLEVDRNSTAVAYTRRGGFHFGFPGDGPPVKRTKNRARSLPRDALTHDLAEKSAAWLEALSRGGRMSANEYDMAATLGVVARASNLYGLNPNAAFERATYCGRDAAGASTDGLNTFLHVAIRCVDAEAVRRLLAQGALPHVLLREIGMNIFAIGDGVSTQYVCPMPEDVFAVLAMLQSAGMKLDAPLDAAGHTLLTEAAYGSLELVRFLLAHGCDVNRSGARGRTPIALAAAFGRYEVFEELLKAGAQAKIADDDGNTPLHAAVARGDERMARTLIEKGANPDAVSRQGMTSLMMACSPALVDLLYHAGANVDFAAYGGQTALILATKMNRLDVVRSLLQCGADVEAATDHGEVAVHFAASIFDSPSRLRFLDALLQAGADVNEETNEGLTPLMIAARAVAEDAISVMIRAGADVNAADRSGDTALLKVLQSGNSRMAASVSLLLEAGADVAHANAAGQTGLKLAAGPDIPDPVRYMIQKAAQPGDSP